MLRLVARFIALIFRLLFYPLYLFRFSRAALPSGWLAVELDGRIEDIAAPRRLWERFRSAPVTLHALDELARAMATDPRVRGLVVTIRDARFGMATASSLRAVFRRIRESERGVVVYLPRGGHTRECFAAFAGTQVLIGPQATLAPLGFASTTPYVSKALGKLGLLPEVIARGKYKSAGESLVRDSMSEPQKEQLGALVESFYRALLASVAAGRGIDEKKAAELVDGAPYMGKQAVEAGLADACIYDDGLFERLEPPGIESLVPAMGYLTKRSFKARLVPRRGVIGVIRVHGAIVQTGASSAGRVAEGERIASLVRRARESKQVLGVILHIDSPGGSALASDVIHHELLRLARDKPLVACMANVAASGGYYVAAAAHAIVAQPTTITGSIGVVGARVALEPLLARIGVTAETVKRGAHADFYQPFHTMTSDERAAWDRDIGAIYQVFVEVVAQGRNKTVEEVEVLAQGRVWSGADAHAKGLVDELGGFDKALDLVRTRIGKAGERAQPFVLAPSRRRVSREERDLGRAAAALGWVAGERVPLELLALARSGERALMWASVGVL